MSVNKTMSRYRQFDVSGCQSKHSPSAYIIKSAHLQSLDQLPSYASLLIIYLQGRVNWVLRCKSEVVMLIGNSNSNSIQIQIKNQQSNKTATASQNDRVNKTTGYYNAGGKKQLETLFACWRSSYCRWHVACIRSVSRTKVEQHLLLLCLDLECAMATLSLPLS